MKIYEVASWDLYSDYPEWRGDGEFFLSKEKAERDAEAQNEWTVDMAARLFEKEVVAYEAEVRKQEFLRDNGFVYKMPWPPSFALPSGATLKSVIEHETVD
jgi:hypothetical protein